MGRRADKTVRGGTTPALRRRGLAVCVIASLVLHAAALAAVAGWPPRDHTGGRDASTPQDQPEPPEPEETRLGIASSTRATITWLGFAEPTPHRGAESELEQAALRMAPLGTPAPPSGDPTDPGLGAPPPLAALTDVEAEDSETPERAIANADPPQTEAIEQVPTESIAETAPDPVATPPTEIETDQEAETLLDAEPDEPTPVEPAPSGPETDDPEQTAPTESTPGASENDLREPTEPIEAEDADDATEPAEAVEDGSPPAVQRASEADAGASSRPGELAERESTAASKTVDLRITNWGRPAAGEGIEIRTRHPQFPDTLAVFRRVLDATVLIDFGADGRVRDVRFETVTIKKRKVVRSTGSPEGDRVVLNCVYNWTAEGEEIDRLAEQGDDARVTIRMEMRIRP